MPRPLRMEYPGAIYHVMNRGDRREPIFHDDVDRKRFVTTLGEACAKTDWQVQAYCLMNNHFHLVELNSIRQPQHAWCARRQPMAIVGCEFLCKANEGKSSSLEVNFIDVTGLNPVIKSN